MAVSHTLRKCGAFGVILASLLFAAPVDAEQCSYALGGKEEPHYVLGSLVIPQGSLVIMAECGKTVEQVIAERDAELARLAKEEEERQARLKTARAATGDVISDHEKLQALARARNRLLSPEEPPAVAVAARGDDNAGAALPLIDGNDLFVDWRQYLRKRVAVRGVVSMADSNSTFFNSGAASFVLEMGDMDTETKRFFLKNCNQPQMDVPADCETTINAVMRGMEYGTVHLGRVQVIAE